MQAEQQVRAAGSAAVALLLAAAACNAAGGATHHSASAGWHSAGLVLALLALPLLAYTAVGARALRRQWRHDVAELAARRAREQIDLIERDHLRANIEDVLRCGSRLEMHYQPILDLPSRRIVGHEALARFDQGGPESWFEQAADLGLGVDLELKAVAQALSGLDQLDGYISINIGPTTLLDDRFWPVIEAVDGQRVVVELTEHVRVDEYERYEAALLRLKQLRIRLAIDDAGAGHSSMRHIIHMAPDIIKLDRSLTSMVDIDVVKRSLVSALVGFATAIDASIVAEGVERPEEATAMTALGVGLGQGWLYAKAMPLHVAAAQRELVDLR